MIEECFGREEASSRGRYVRSIADIPTLSEIALLLKKILGALRKCV